VQVGVLAQEPHEGVDLEHRPQQRPPGDRHGAGVQLEEPLEEGAGAVAEHDQRQWVVLGCDGLVERRGDLEQPALGGLDRVWRRDVHY
jgi:hypothetical protein